MYESITVESIKTDILKRLKTNIDAREGSFANDMISAVAYEVWETYQSLNAIIPIAYIDETSGAYIDKRCEEYGITRKPGSKATAVLTITGTNNTVIPKGTIFMTAEGFQFVTDSEATISEGTAAVGVTAAVIGANYNVAAGTITLQKANLSGITSVTNSAAVGGTDIETDASLVSRFYDHLRSTATSGNIAHYRQWAMAVNGVGNAKVIPLFNGPGTVKVLIVGNDNRTPTDDVLAACEDYINERRPIGATVTVEKAPMLSISINAVVTTDGSTTKEQINDRFKAEMAEYFKSKSFSSYTLSYNRLVYMLLDTAGVKDFTTLTINGGTGNISIGETQVPVIEVVIQ